MPVDQAVLKAAEEALTPKERAERVIAAHLAQLESRAGGVGILWASACYTHAEPLARAVLDGEKRYKSSISACHECDKCFCLFIPGGRGMETTCGTCLRAERDTLKADLARVRADLERALRALEQEREWAEKAISMIESNGDRRAKVARTRLEVVEIIAAALGQPEAEKPEQGGE